MDFKTIDGTVLHTAEFGDPSGKPIVFANSLGTDLRIWLDVVFKLGGYRSIVMDKRGHGLSQLGEETVTIPRLGKDVLGVMDAYGIDKAAICGVSIGGLIAQQVHHLAPERTEALIVCDSAAKIGSDEIWLPRIEKIREAGMEAIGDATMERWFSGRFMRERQAELAGYRTMLVRTNAEGYVACAEAIRTTDLRDKAGDISVPVQAVVGEEDGATPPDVVSAFAQSVPGARYVAFPETGHIPSIECPEKLTQVIRDFLAGIGY